MPHITKNELESGLKIWREKGKITNREKVRSWLFDKDEIQALIGTSVTHLRFYLYQEEEGKDEKIKLAAFAVISGDTEREENLIRSDDRYTVSYSIDYKEDTKSELYLSPHRSEKKKDNKGVLEQIPFDKSRILIGLYCSAGKDPSGGLWEYPYAKDTQGNLTKAHAFRFTKEDVEGALQKSTQYIRMYMASKTVLPNLPIKSEEEGLATLVMVGTDQEGKDIYNAQESGDDENDSGIFDITKLCPPACGNNIFPNIGNV